MILIALLIVSILLNVIFQLRDELHIHPLERHDPKPWGFYASGGIVASTSGSSFVQGPYD